MVSPGDAVLLLTMLYEGTGGGAAWRVSTGWLDVTTPVCDWHGVTCNGAGNVTAVELEGNGLDGVLPSEVGLSRTSCQRASVTDGAAAALIAIVAALRGRVCGFLRSDTYVIHQSSP